MRDELLSPAADPVEAAEETTLRPRRLDEFVGQPRLREHLEIMLTAAAPARPGGRPRAARRAAGPRQDQPGRDHRHRDGRALPADERARARTRGRPRRDPHEPRRRRRAVHRRGAPAAAAGRGGAVSRDGGLPARHRDREGPVGAHDPPRPAALHARRRDDAHRARSPGRCATASASSPASTTTSPTSSPRSSPAPRRSSASSSTPTAPSEIARRCRGTPRIANRLLKRVRDYAEVRADGRVDARYAHATRSRCSRSTSSASTRSTARSSPRCAARSPAARSGSARSRSRSARRPRRSKTCTSRSCCSAGCSSARRAAGSRRRRRSTTSACTPRLARARLRACSDRRDRPRSGAGMTTSSRYEVRDRIAHVTIDNGKANALVARRHRAARRRAQPGRGRGRRRGRRAVHHRHAGHALGRLRPRR